MKRPLRNVLSLLAGDVGSRVLGFFITIYLARVLEASAFGIVNIGFGVLGYLMLVASPGIQVLETRNAAADIGINQERINTILSLRLTLALALIAVTALLANVLIHSEETRQSIIYFSVSLIPLSLFLDWFFQGKEEFGSVSAARLLSYVMYGGCVLVVVSSAADVRMVPVAFAVGSAAATLFLFLKYHAFGRFTYSWEPAQWKSVLRANVPVGFSMFLAQSAVNLPAIVIGWLVTTAEAGIFSAALKIIFVLLMLDRILNAVLLPAATRYFTQRADDVPRFLSRVTKFVVVALIPITLIGIALSSEIIRVAFGEMYDAAVLPLQLLMGYFFLTVLNSIFVCGLIAAGREQEYTRAINIGSTVFVIGIVGGTAMFGMPGAAYGVVLGECITVLLTVSAMKKFVHIPWMQTLTRPALAGLAMIIAMVLLRSQQNLVASAIGLLVFIGSLIMLRAIDAGDIQFLRERLV